MSEELAHHPHGPSALPKLSKCIHFLGGKAAGEAASRGTMLHEQIATRFSDPSNASEVDEAAMRGISRATLLFALGKICGIEERFTLTNASFDELTFGTMDLWGYDKDGLLTVVDFKSGAMMNGPEAYTEQLAAYGLMVMDREDQQECQVTIIPLDDEATDYHVARFTYDEAASIVMPIFDRIEEATEPPRENDGCGWCSRRETCEVWLKPAETALTVIDALPATISREWIEASPQNAGMARTALKKLEAIFKDIDVDGKVKSALEAGDDVPGWKLQARKGSESVSAEEVLTKMLQGMGIAKVAPFLKVDAKGLKKAWAEFTSEPFPCQTTEGAGTVSIVAAKGGK